MPSQPPNDGSALEIRPLLETFAAEVQGVDLSQEVRDDRFAAIHGAFLRYQVLLFRDQNLTAAQHVELARRFGEVQLHVLDQYHHGGYPELYFLSNLDQHGRPSGRHPDRGTIYWHTDGSWTKTATQATLLFSIEVPSEGGQTHFADMYRAYESLDGTMRSRIADLRAVHNLDFSRTRRHDGDPMTDEQKRKVPPVDHPVVRTHPETGRKCLFLGDHAEHIVGMDYDAGRALIEELNRLATRAELVYRHQWQPRELVIWDNRCTLHRATSFDTAAERRVIRRATVLGDVPY